MIVLVLLEIILIMVEKDKFDVSFYINYDFSDCGGSGGSLCFRF